MNIDIGVKVRPYKLHCTLAEFGNTQGNRRVFEKENTPCIMNVYFDKDIYLDLGVKEELEGILSKAQGRQMTQVLTAEMETTLLYFIKTCFSKNQASFEEPEGQYYKIDGECYFEYY